MSQQKVVAFRWFALVTLCVLSIAQGMLLISPAPLVGELVKVLNVSLGQVTGATMGPFILSVAVSAIIGGVIIDKFGLATMYIISALLMILGTVLIPFLGDALPGLVICRILQGLGCGPVIGSPSKVASEWFPSKERAIVTGIQGASLSIGIAVGFGVAPALFAKTGNWQTALAAMAVISVIGLLAAVIFALGPNSPHLGEAEGDLGQAAESENDFGKALKLPVFWVGVFSAFLLSWAMQGYNDIIPGHLAIERPVGLNLGPVVAGKYMGLLQIAFMVGSALSGLLVAKIFKGAHRRLISLAFLLTGVFCLSIVLPMVNIDQKILLVCLIFAGFFMGMPIPSTLAFIAEVYPEHITGRVGGATMGLAIIGGVLGVAVGSSALHFSGMYTISIFVVGAVCLLGMINGFGLKSPGKIFD